MHFACVRTIGGSPAPARVEGDDVLLLDAAPWLGGKPNGTPHGVGPLSDGDRVELEIEKLGALDFRVAAER